MLGRLRNGLSWRSSLFASVLAIIATVWQCQPFDGLRQSAAAASGTAVFKQGIDEVFGFVSNPTTVNEWLPMVKYIRSREDPDAVGKEITVVFETGCGM